MKLWTSTITVTLMTFCLRVTVQQCTIEDYKGVVLDMIELTEGNKDVLISETYYNCLSRSDNGYYGSISVSLLYNTTNSRGRKGRTKRSSVRYNLLCNNGTWEIVGNQSTALRNNNTRYCEDCTDQTVNENHCTSKLFELLYCVKVSNSSRLKSYSSLSPGINLKLLK